MCNCERAQELISAYIDGEITAGEKAELDEHVAGCRDCADMLAVYSEISRAMAEDVEPPASLRESVMSGVREINAERKPKKAKIVWLRWVSAAAAVAIVSFVGVRAIMPKGADSAAPMLKAANANGSVEYSINTAPSEITDEAAVEFAPTEPEEAPAAVEDSGLEASLFMFPASPTEEAPAASNSVDIQAEMKALMDASESEKRTYIISCSVDNSKAVVELCKSLGGEILYGYNEIGGCAVRIPAEEAESFVEALEASELVLGVTEDSVVTIE
ncbi:MAG: zf-HC2 domain-containing protein [Oscillospiraceae bacterium]|nr:zf-HC2 domain-containing protein [Oscillospiraceae bacterium]